MRRFELVGKAPVRLVALALVALPAALGAQIEDAGTGVHQLRAIEIVDASWGQEVRLESDGPLDRVGAQLFQGLGVLVQLPGHLPGPGVGGLSPTSGLISAVELDLEQDAEGPVTRVIVRTREPVSQSVSSENGVLIVRLAPFGLPAVGAPPAPAATGGDVVEVATLQGALEHSNRARGELAARIEGLNAEAETLRERVRALEAHRQVLETDLDSTRTQAAELSRELTQRGQELEQESDGSAQREAELLARIAGLEAARAELVERNQELDIRVQAATLERRELGRELDVGSVALDEARARGSALDSRVAELAAELEEARVDEARLAAELEQVRSEADRQYQRARARTDAAELQRQVVELTGELQQAREAGDRLAGTEEQSRRRLEASQAEREQTADRLAKVSAELEASRGLAAELTTRVAELDAALGEQRGLNTERAVDLDASARDRQSLAERLDVTRRERDQAAGELAAIRAELDRERQGKFDRELQIAREVEYRVAELRRELDSVRLQLGELEAENAALRGRVEAEAAGGAPSEAGLAEAESEPAPDGESTPLATAAAPAPRPGLGPTPSARAWTTTAARMRSEPSTGGQVLASLPEATEIEAAPGERGWTPSVLRRQGWVLGSFLELAADGSDEAVTTDRVNLRTAPDLDSAVLGSLPLGTRVALVEEREGWYQIRVEQQGWIYSSLLSYTPPPQPVAASPVDSGLTGRTISDVNLRAGPGTDSEIVTQLRQDTAAVVLLRSGAWYRVSAAGNEGWLHYSLLRLDPGTDG